MQRISIIIPFFICFIIEGRSQCPSSINVFPYHEGFEMNDGGWVAAGTGNDWIWGTPSKPVINAAGEGTKCWITGGLTVGPYTDGEASWLQSPCFDFTGLTDPYVEFKVFWETEYQFDGASFQYSLDNGGSWTTVGSAADGKNCMNANWFNYSSINYLSPLTPVKDGWTGNIQSTSGSCKGGNGSNGWLTAKHSMPFLAGQPSVVFRFIFGAGTICNNYDGFAFDDFLIDDAPANSASFTYSCSATRTVSFTNTSTPCPTVFSWDFGDPGSGTNNTSALKSPTHAFSAAGSYTVTLTASGPGTSSSTISNDITVLDVSVTALSKADCRTNSGGSLSATVSGNTAPINYSWNTSPVQTTPVATGLAAGEYTVTISGTGICTTRGEGIVELDPACIAIWFPSAFTPDNNGRNDRFGPLGTLNMISNYRFEVYNRWGQLVFHSSDPYQKWDGKLSGESIPSFLFTWRAEFTLNGVKQSRRGTVVLIR